MIDNEGTNFEVEVDGMQNFPRVDHLGCFLYVCEHILDPSRDARLRSPAKLYAW